MIGCSAALTISGMPVHGPDRRRTRRLSNGQLAINPTMSEMKESALNSIWLSPVRKKVF
jgi:polyribonucleotide nucleotidyltransferase